MNNARLYLIGEKDYLIGGKNFCIKAMNLNTSINIAFSLEVACLQIGNSLKYFLPTSYIQAFQAGNWSFGKRDFKAMCIIFTIQIS